MADALATLASRFQVNDSTHMMPIRMSIRESLAHCSNIKEKVDGNSWFHDIKRYIKDQQYPKNTLSNDKKTLRRMAINFFLDGEIFYKKGFDKVLSHCVDANEAQKILHEIHEGICGAHASGHTMARQITREGYYWFTLERDCIQYARKCHKCHIYGDKIHVPLAPLHVMNAPWPFSM
ncbi:hypothetical protein PTKIN_Ptkin06aG0124000 [Pterospermum kingtungense]